MIEIQMLQKLFYNCLNRIKNLHFSKQNMITHRKSYNPLLLWMTSYQVIVCVYNITVQ